MMTGFRSLQNKLEEEVRDTASVISFSRIVSNEIDKLLASVTIPKTGLEINGISVTSAEFLSYLLAAKWMSGTNHLLSCIGIMIVADIDSLLYGAKDAGTITRNAILLEMQEVAKETLRSRAI